MFYFDYGKFDKIGMDQIWMNFNEFLMNQMKNHVCSNFFCSKRLIVFYVRDLNTDDNQDHPMISCSFNQMKIFSNKDIF